MNRRDRILDPLLVRLIWGGIAFLAVAGVCAPATAGTFSEEHAVKAAFLHRFLDFIEWPEGIESEEGSFDICVLGEDPFGEVLETTFQDRTVAGRPIRLVRCDTLEEAKSCRVVFLVGADEQRLAELVESFDGHPVLTVTEAPGFAEKGSMINFVLDDGSIGFEVNRGQVGDSGLYISSRLLALARVVESAAR